MNGIPATIVGVMPGGMRFPYGQDLWMPRTAIKTTQDVRVSNGSVQLAGTLIRPARPGPHPAVILLHASGPEDREYLPPYARFLVRCA